MNQRDLMINVNKNMDKLVDTLNHRVTKLETNVKWITKLVWYIAAIMTGGFIKFIFI